MRRVALVDDLDHDDVALILSGADADLTDTVIPCVLDEDVEHLAEGRGRRSRGEGRIADRDSEWLACGRKRAAPRGARRIAGRCGMRSRMTVRTYAGRHEDNLSPPRLRLSSGFDRRDVGMCETQQTEGPTSAKRESWDQGLLSGGRSQTDRAKMRGRLGPVHGDVIGVLLPWCSGQHDREAQPPLPNEQRSTS